MSTTVAGAAPPRGAEIVVRVFVAAGAAAVLGWTVFMDVECAGHVHDPDVSRHAIDWGFVLLPACVFMLLTLTPGSGGRPWSRRIGCATFAIALAVAVLPWHARKRFINDLHAVRPGMTVDEVERVMGGYVKGGGWAIPAGPAPVVLGAGEVRDAAEEADIQERADAARLAYEAPDYPAGDRRAHARGTMTYRWNTTDAAYDADLGRVTFQDGRVVSVEFLPD